VQGGSRTPARSGFRLLKKRLQSNITRFRHKNNRAYVELRFMKSGRGRDYGFSFRSVFKAVSVLLLVMYTFYFLLVFYAAFSNEESYTAIVDINSLGEAFLEAALLVPFTLMLISIGLFFLFRDKTRFHKNMSYELRTYLNNIIGYVEVLQQQQKGSLNEGQKEALEVVNKNARDILITIDDIDSLWR